MKTITIPYSEYQEIENKLAFLDGEIGVRAYNYFSSEELKFTEDIKTCLYPNPYSFITLKPIAFLEEVIEENKKLTEGVKNNTKHYKSVIKELKGDISKKDKRITELDWNRYTLKAELEQALVEIAELKRAQKNIKKPWYKRIF